MLLLEYHYVSVNGEDSSAKKTLGMPQLLLDLKCTYGMSGA